MHVRGSWTVLSMLALGACGSEAKPGDVDVDDRGAEGERDAGREPDAGNEPNTRLFALGVPCDDDAADLYGDPGELPDGQGAIMRCVDDGVISKEQIATRLDALTSDSRSDPEAIAAGGGTLNVYAGIAPKVGTHVYRVLYRTERGNGQPGYSVATMYVPDGDVSAPLPLVLLARGSRGQAGNCAPSLTTDGPITIVDSPDGRYTQSDIESMVWPLVASGFALAVTDSAGYANYGAEGNPGAGYADVGDAGKSFIDSGHALHRLLPEGTTTDVLMVGLSQGGHTVLGSLQTANEYPAPGKILAAAVYSPLWFSQRAWGSALSPLAPVGGLLLNKSSAVPVSIWYHYTHAELHDGPGEGIKLFKPELQSVIKDFVDNTCWSETYKKLEDAIVDPPEGGITAAEFFRDDFSEAVGMPAFNRSCEESSDKPLCEKWLQRYRDDHPVLTGAAGQVPILVAYGLKDTRIIPPRFKCGVEKLEMGENELDFCIDPAANHGGIVLTQSQFVNEWLANKASGAAMTTACPSTTPPDDSCDALNPND
jgi:hypothetical protein